MAASARQRRTPVSAGSPAPLEHACHYPWVRLRSGSAHQFIYRRMISEVDPQARPGDVVAVYKRDGAFFGHAFYHDRSQIALRVLSHEPAAVDEAFFRKRLETALEWRRRLFGADSATDVYRLVHSEGDWLSGLVAERYADAIAIEVFSLGVYRRLELFQRLLTELTGLSRFVVRADERVEQLEGFRVRRAGPPGSAGRSRARSRP
ncbi:MAG: hypothetical protein HRF43_18260, partial [Phycisphaerae bacterium]